MNLVALLSVSNKHGLLELARGLHEAGLRLIGSGGTAKAVRESGVPIECAQVRRSGWQARDSHS